MIYETRNVGHWKFILNIFWISFGCCLDLFLISFVFFRMCFGCVLVVFWTSSGCLFDIFWIFLRLSLLVVTEEKSAKKHNIIKSKLTYISFEYVAQTIFSHLTSSR